MGGLDKKRGGKAEREWCLVGYYLENEHIAKILKNSFMICKITKYE